MTRTGAAAPPSVGLPGGAEDLIFWFDRLTLFERTLHAAGWIVPRSPSFEIVRATLRFSDVALPLAPRLPSPDLEAHYGPHASALRFDDMLELDPMSAATCDPVLVVELSTGVVVEIGDLALKCASLDPVHQLTVRFLERLAALVPGTILEIGARQRIGATLRPKIDPKWSFVGLDIHAGSGVDVVGDAHRLSDLFPRDRFDAVVSLAVFEHLLMPWKVAVELNRVMKPGAIGFVVAPQAWPVHDEPWDYFRFSANAWTALFNSATGFEILEARHGEKAYLIAERVHPGVNFLASSCALASAVLFRKTSDTALDWPVPLESVVHTNYPR